MDIFLACAAANEWKALEDNRDSVQSILKILIYLLDNSSSTLLHLNERLIIWNLGKKTHLNVYSAF